MYRKLEMKDYLYIGLTTVGTMSVAAIVTLFLISNGVFDNGYSKFVQAEGQSDEDYYAFLQSELIEVLSASNDIDINSKAEILNITNNIYFDESYNIISNINIKYSLNGEIKYGVYTIDMDANKTVSQDTASMYYYFVEEIEDSISRDDYADIKLTSDILGGGVPSHMYYYTKNYTVDTVTLSAEEYDYMVGDVMAEDEVVSLSNGELFITQVLDIDGQNVVSYTGVNEYIK